MIVSFSQIFNLDTFELVRELATSGGSVYSVVVTNHHILCGTYEHCIHVRLQYFTHHQITTKKKALIDRVVLLFCAAGLGAEHVRTVQDVDGSLGNGVRTGCAQHAFRNEGLQRVVRSLAAGESRCSVCSVMSWLEFLNPSRSSRLLSFMILFTNSS